MKVLKIVAEGLTTSFRYPHFMLQIHPSFQMPPPATIYGHICSALGEWFDPNGVQFAYHFTHQGHVRDIEHIIVLAPPKSNHSKLPGTQIPNVLEGNVNPFERELLFQPRLTLYINRPEWEAASEVHAMRFRWAGRKTYSLTQKSASLNCSKANGSTLSTQLFHIRWGKESDEAYRFYYRAI